jgi:hypothetical protein
MQKLDPLSSRVDESPRLNNYMLIFSWALLFLLIAGSLQYNIPYPWDNDTAYHAVVGKLIREHGILHSFPWTPFSWLADHYADKELLFHLLFVPFAALGWTTAAQIVGTFLGATLLLVFYLMLRSERVRFAGLWTLIPLTSSVLFFFRFVLVRPHLLSVTLSLLLLWAALRRKLLVLAVVSIIFPWAYVAFWQLPCLLLIAAETARLLSGERIDWKPAGVVFAGIAAGVATHPNAVNLLGINWTEMADLLFAHSWGRRTGIEVVGELNPYPLPAWVQGLTFNVLMTIAALIIAWRNRRKEFVSLAFALAAAGFCILTIKSARFAEYFVPFSVAAMALASRAIAWRFLPQVIIGITIAWMAWVQPNFLLNLSKRQNDMPPDIARLLQQEIPSGAQVFDIDWDYAGWLMLTLPDRRFIVALDHTFLYKKDPELYWIWYQIRHEAPAGSAEAIRRYFGARYVLGFNTPLSRNLFKRLSSEPGVRALLVSDTWTLFDLGVQSP